MSTITSNVSELEASTLTTSAATTATESVPTLVETLERAAALIEGGMKGLAFRAGEEALRALLGTLEPGDEIIVARELLAGPARGVLAEHADLGIVLRGVDPLDIVGVAGAITRRTKWLWIPEITRSRVCLVDIERLSKIARIAGVRTLVDATETTLGRRAIGRGADATILWNASRLAGDATTLALLVLNDARTAFSVELVRDGITSPASLAQARAVLAGLPTASERARIRVENARVIASELVRERGVIGVHRARGAIEGATVLVEIAGGFETAQRVACKLRLWHEGSTSRAGWSIHELNGVVESNLHRSENLVPCVVEVITHVGPVAALAESEVAKTDARLAFAFRCERDDDPGAALAFLWKLWRRIP
jgi:cystathionine beta-lyase/cystathionine gamma-synthase